MDDKDIVTTNKFLVTGEISRLVFLKPVPRELSHADALLLAAYLVSLVADDSLWKRTLEAVQNA